MAIFSDFIENTMEVFMDDFSGEDFDRCLRDFTEMRGLVQHWEKCHFMVREGIVLGHKVSKSGIEVDRAKIDVSCQLAPPATQKEIRGFLGGSIGGLSRTSPLCHLLAGVSLR